MGIDVQRERKKLVFKGNYVFWAGEEGSAKKATSQPWKLVKAALAQDKVHWLEGFLLFDSWRKHSQQGDYLKQFRTIATKTGYALEAIGIKNAKMICESDGVYWKLSSYKYEEPLSNITEAVLLAQKAEVDFRKGNSLEAFASLKAAFELWPDAPSVCRALMGGEALPRETPDSKQFLAALSELLEKYEANLIDAVTRLSLRANHRLQGITFDNCKDFLLRWLMEIAKVGEAKALFANSGPIKPHSVDEKTRRFAKLADTFVNNYISHNESDPADAPDSIAKEKEKTASLEQLCACQLVREATDRTVNYFEQVKHLGVRPEDVQRHLQDAVYDFLQDESIPIVLSGHMVGRLNRHIRIFVQTQYTTRELKKSFASEKVDYDQLHHKLLTLLKNVSQAGNISEKQLHQTVGKLVNIRERAPEGLRRHIRSFDTIISDRIQDFTGRDFVFKAIDKFTVNNSSGYFFIKGDPGIGKSSIAAKLVVERGYVHHFNSRANGWTSAADFLKNTCAQLIVQYNLNYDSLPVEASEKNEFLIELLDEISAKLDVDEKAVMVVDGLDEVEDSGNQSNRNILSLPSILPKGLFVVATTRRTPLTLRIDCAKDKIDLKPKLPENLRDVKEYLQYRAGSTGIQTYIRKQNLTIQDFVSIMKHKSEGNFMYLRYVLHEIEEKSYKDVNIEQIPEGLQDYYEDHWRRMGMMEKPLPEAKIKIIYVMSELQEPVSRAFIANVTCEKEVLVQKVIDEWTQFLHRQIIEGELSFSVYHTSFNDFLNRKEIVQAAGVSLPEINEIISDRLLTLFNDVQETE